MYLLHPYAVYRYTIHEHVYIYMNIHENTLYLIVLFIFHKNYVIHRRLKIRICIDYILKNLEYILEEYTETVVLNNNIILVILCKEIMSDTRSG